MADNDLFAVIAGRRTSRRFSPRPVEMDKILQVIQAGMLAPSSGNIQNWSFIVVTDLERIRKMYDLCLHQEPFLSATAAIVVAGDIDHAHSMYGVRGKKVYTVQNCAAAVENMLLAAHALGVGSVWIGAFDEDLIQDMFQIPSTNQPQAIVLLGYSAADPDPKETKSLADSVFFNTFGNRVQRPHLVFYNWAEEWRLQAQKVKAHAAHAVSKVKERRAAAPPKESPTGSSLADAKDRMKRVIEGLKREKRR